MLILGEWMQGVCEKFVKRIRSIRMLFKINFECCKDRTKVINFQLCICIALLFHIYYSISSHANKFYDTSFFLALLNAGIMSGNSLYPHPTMFILSDHHHHQ